MYISRLSGFLAAKERLFGQPQEPTPVYQNWIISLDNSVDLKLPLDIYMSNNKFHSELRRVKHPAEGSQIWGRGTDGVNEKLDFFFFFKFISNRIKIYEPMCVFFFDGFNFYLWNLFLTAFVFITSF